MRFSTNQRVDNAIYWGTFLFAVFVSGYVLTMLISESSDETSTYMSDSSYMRRFSQVATVETSLGDISIRFLRSQAPITVGNFSELSEAGFYDNTKVHKIVKGKYVEAGDPLTREDDKELYGTGGPGYVFDDEIRGLKMDRGTVAMMNAGRKKTNGSRFFIVTAESLPDMEGKYTIFGRVVGGMDIVDKMNAVSVDSRLIPKEPIVIKRITVE